MPTRMSRAESFGLAALALLGTAGGSVFGALASEGGEGHLRNIILGVVCAIVLTSVTAINRFIDIRFLRPEASHGNAVAARERAALSQEGAERQAAEVQGDAETRVVIGLRARLSPALYCLGKIAAASSGTVEAPLIGSLTQAIVAAAVEHREHDEFRRSIFFAVKGDVMECACYAGYEGKSLPPCGGHPTCQAAPGGGSPDGTNAGSSRRSSRLTRSRWCDRPAGRRRDRPELGSASRTSVTG